jgi:hypothetical protein
MLCHLLWIAHFARLHHVRPIGLSCLVYLRQGSPQQELLLPVPLLSQ